MSDIHNPCHTEVYFGGEFTVAEDEYCGNVFIVLRVDASMLSEFDQVVPEMLSSANQTSFVVAR